MTTYRMWPVDVEAIQFTGDNWAEMHAFTGHAMIEDGPEHPVDVFMVIEDHKLAMGYPTGLVSLGEILDATAVVWIDVLSRWHPVSPGDWIIKTRDAFQHLPEAEFKEYYREVTDPDFGEDDPSTPSGTDEPTETGFYYNDGAAQTMIYLLDGTGQWWAITDDLTTSKCQWEYIEQTVETFPLKKLGA